MLRWVVVASLCSLLLSAAASAAPVPVLTPRPAVAAPFQLKKVPRYMWRTGSQIIPSSTPVEVPTCNPLDAILGKGQPITKTPRKPALCQILNH
jgi:hypothetical protein